MQSLMWEGWLFHNSGPKTCHTLFRSLGAEGYSVINIARQLGIRRPSETLKACFVAFQNP